ncbi:MAG TPA: AtpZ/AtpI family protein [Fimbriimonadaceae bacterium]
MPDDEQKEPEEDEFERRFREIEEKTASIRQKATAPDVPHITVPERKTTEEKLAVKPKSTNPPHVQKGLGIAFAIGYSFVGPLLAGILIGTLLDGKPGGKYTLIGILVGTVMAFVLLIRLVNKLNQDD